MRCKSCDSLEGKWQRQWDEYYCQECVDAIYDSLDEFDEEELGMLEELYWDE